VASTVSPSFLNGTNGSISPSSDLAHCASVSAAKSVFPNTQVQSVSVGPVQIGPVQTSSQYPVSDKAPRRSASTDVGASTSTQPLTTGTGLCVVKEQDAISLFELFFTKLNVRWGLLKKEVHTIDFCRTTSPFLYNTSALELHSKGIRFTDTYCL
jgi:hypothetical protein